MAEIDAHLKEDELLRLECLRLAFETIPGHGTWTAPALIQIANQMATFVKHAKVP